MNCIALQYNIGLKDHPVRENVAFPDRSTARCLLCDCTTSNAAGFPRYMGRSADLNRLNDATSDPSTLVHSHHTGFPALEWIT